MTYHFKLLIQRKFITRFDLLPFLFLYAVTFFLYHNQLLNQLYIKLLFIVFLISHVVTFIIGWFNHKSKAFLVYRQIKGLQQKNLFEAGQILITSQTEKQTSFQIVDLLMQQQQNDSKTFQFVFYYRQQKFIYDKSTSNFYKIQPKLQSLSLKQLMEQAMNQNKANKYKNFQSNLFQIPIPKFKDILFNEILHPFSFLQVISNVLWIMDNQSSFTVFSLGLIFVSNYFMTCQQMKNMVNYRSLALHPIKIFCYRDNKWQKISSSKLIPSDIVLIQRGDKQQKDKSYSPISDKQFLSKQIPLLGGAFGNAEPINVQNFKNVPCDLLILSGSCVVDQSILTGESIPQLKQSIQNQSQSYFFDQKNKSNLLYCGTRVLQINQSKNLPKGLVLAQKQPVPGAVAMVTRTGFDTSKGKLVRKVLSSFKRLKIEKDSLILVVFLLVVAIIASLYVLKFGLADQKLNQQKLLIRCILIISTVVPPELPIILNMVVNSTMTSLMKKKIFCIQKQRIPMGGKTTLIAFDKTGTLTQDQLTLQCIIQNLIQQIKLNYQNISLISQIIMAGCHSLIQDKQVYIGDPLQRKFFDQNIWKFNGQTRKAEKRGQIIYIKSIFPFKSQLKRMSTVVECRGEITKNLVLSKGAPQIMKTLMRQVPQNYDQILQKTASQGFRILTICYKQLTEQQHKNYNQMGRQKLQTQLNFGAFIIFRSQLKQDTKQVLQSLRLSQFQVIMITGDNLLTAINVAQNLDFGKQKAIIKYNQGKIQAHLLNRIQQITPQKLPQRSWITATQQTSKLPQWIFPFIKVFARTSPVQKQRIVLNLKKIGKSVMFCGDGTNDVGGLKASDAGLAISGTRQKQRLNIFQKQKKQAQQRNKQEMMRINMDPNLGFRQKLTKLNQLRMKQQSFQSNFFQGEPQLKPGDASVAAHFTSKFSSSIYCVQILLRQCICTLASSIQIKKYVTVNSLIFAFSLACLNIQGLKYSEKQKIYLGISGLFCFYQLTNAKPVKQISIYRPPSTIFNKAWIVSVLGQTSILIFSTLYCYMYIAIKYRPAEQKVQTYENEQEKFIPTFTNTVVFLQTSLTNSILFIFNNGGAPYVKGLSESPTKLKILLASLLIPIIMASNFFPELNSFMDLNMQLVSREVQSLLFADCATWCRGSANSYNSVDFWTGSEFDEFMQINKVCVKSIRFNKSLSQHSHYEFDIVFQGSKYVRNILQYNQMILNLQSAHSVLYKFTKDVNKEPGENQFFLNVKLQLQLNLLYILDPQILTQFLRKGFAQYKHPKKIKKWNDKIQNTKNLLTSFIFPKLTQSFSKEFSQISKIANYLKGLVQFTKDNDRYTKANLSANNLKKRLEHVQSVIRIYCLQNKGQNKFELENVKKFIKNLLQLCLRQSNQLLLKIIQNPL